MDKNPRAAALMFSLFVVLSHVPLQPVHSYLPIRSSSIELITNESVWSDLLKKNDAQKILSRAVPIRWS